MNNFDAMLRRWKRSLSQLFSGLKGGGSSGDKAPDIKMCPVCGRFVTAGARKCDYCDAELGAKPAPEPSSSGNGSNDPINPIMIVFGICIAFFFVSIFLSAKLADYDLMDSFWKPAGEVLRRMGSNYGVETFGNSPDLWRLVTYMFLHGDMLHIFMNLMALGYLGPLTLHNFGARRFWLITLITGIGGGVLSASTYFPLGLYAANSVGLSGALFGYLGANYVYFKNNGYIGEAIRFRNFMIWMNVIMILLTLGRILNIDNFAHIGGMVAGLGVAWFFDSHIGKSLSFKFERMALTALLVFWFYGLYKSFLLINALFG